MTDAPASWRNRIVGHGEEAPEQLLANPRNWRIHPKAQQDALGEVLDRVGWVQDVIVNQRTQHVLDGHLRVALAISREEPIVPVVYVDLDDDEEALMLASLDPLSAMAVTDQEALAALIEGLDSVGGPIAAMLDSLGDKASVEERMREWAGMPEFVQPEAGSKYAVVVHFETEEAQHSFEALIGQHIPPNTRSIWHPERKNDRRLGKARYAVES